MDLGKSIKDTRKKLGIKQNYLAEITGLSQTYLSQIENNVKEPNLSTLKLICEHINIPLPVLFFISIDTQDIKPEKQIAFNHLKPSINSMILEFFDNKIMND
ncbi:MAG: helix-turn-helix transcriptional regulator [Saprospiraceae bacterium]|nr:helix-turn-helix transcriptional regulator [Saprospiraceae bacterium]